jgi:hypothetical protein
MLNAIGGQATNATALLSIYESSDPNIMLLSNVLITAQGGNSNAWGSSFTQINQIAFADAHANAVDDFDNITLIPEPSTVLLTLSGVFSVAMMMRRRRSTKARITPFAQRVRSSTGRVASMSVLGLCGRWIGKCGVEQKWFIQTDLNGELES